MYMIMLVLLLMGIATADAKTVGDRNFCTDFEVPVRGPIPQRDRFCKPWVTLHAELVKPRWCLCRPGYIRNSFGQCITLQECFSCAYRRNADYTPCASECPLVCGRPLPQQCSYRCLAGCACAPGFVLDPWQWRECVPASWCPPQCPRHSSFGACANTCSPICGLSPPGRCVSECYYSECVCQQGFAMATHNDTEVCVPKNQCQLVQK
uniref:Putative tick til 24 n=1 Tax=Amblyomma parvum TaxID=251391 RepID=A0A023FZ61_AMBPA